MIRYFMLWYRARTYCPIIDSLRTEPEAWLTASAYREYKSKGFKRGQSFWISVDYSSLYHKDLDIQIYNWEYQNLDQDVTRASHTLPVCKHRIRRAMKAHKASIAKRSIDAARAELNRITQDAQTLRLAKIVQLRKELAQQEAADFAHRIEHG